MITKNFIKQCEQAEEIQKAWEPKLLDKVITKRTLTDNNYSQDAISYIRDFEHPYDEYYYTNYGYIWLPTLEQLFEIWCNLCEATNFAGICQRIVECKRSKIATYPNIKLIKELCLEVIMKEFYNKSWTGEKWAKDSE